MPPLARPVRIAVLSLTVLAAPVLTHAPAAAQNAAVPTAAPPADDPPRILNVARTTRPVAVDGRLDDAAWSTAPVADGFVQARPAPGAPASQPTEVRVLYDDGALYVAARMHDAHPDSIVGRLARRDADVYSDWFAVSIDSHHDRRTAFVFAVNPRGIKRDIALTDDDSEDGGWDAVWDAAVRADSAGWTAEIRIPLSQLRFRAGADADAWGIQFERRIARRGEVSHWAPMPPDGAGLVSRFGMLAGLRGVRPPRRLEVQPFTALRLTRAPGQAADPYHRPSEWLGSAGADVKYGLTGDLTLTATLNPDFGQVEADPSEVNLSGFESYFTEKRPFFTEGADIFATGYPELFYSRRIGRAPQGTPPAADFADVPEATTILGAVKLTGRTNGWTVGLLDAVTADERARFTSAAGQGTARVEPLANYAVGRVARDFRGGRSGIGGIVTATHRRLDGEMDFLRSSAYAGGVDARHRFGNHEVSGAVMGSWIGGSDSAIAQAQRGPGHAFHRPDARHLAYDPTRRSLAGYAAHASVERVSGGPWRWELYGHAFSPGFEVNDLGYHFNVDELRQYASVEYVRHAPGRLFRGWNASVSQSADWTFGGERRDAEATVRFDAQLHSQWDFGGWYARSLGGLSPDALRGGPALLSPGRQMVGARLRTDPRRPVRLALFAAWEAEDGTGTRRLSLSPSLALRPSQRMDVSLSPSVSWNTDTWQYVGQWTDAGAGDADRWVVGHMRQATVSLTARIDYAFTPDLSLQLYAAPFASAGGYDGFREVAAPRAGTFDARFRPLDGELRECVDADGGVFYGVRAQRAGCATGDGGAAFGYRFADPDFTVVALRSNAVLRWEYRPGSTLFVVWTSGRGTGDADGRMQGWAGARDLLRAPGTNVLAVKVSYWLGM
jgi:hypothetical protein